MSLNKITCHSNRSNISCRQVKKIISKRRHCTQRNVHSKRINRRAAGRPLMGGIGMGGIGGIMTHKTAKLLRVRDQQYSQSVDYPDTKEQYHNHLCDTTSTTKNLGFRLNGIHGTEHNISSGHMKSNINVNKEHYAKKNSSPDEVKFYQKVDYCDDLILKYIDIQGQKTLILENEFYNMDFDTLTILDFKIGKVTCYSEAGKNWTFLDKTTENNHEVLLPVGRMFATFFRSRRRATSHRRLSKNKNVQHFRLKNNADLKEFTHEDIQQIILDYVPMKYYATIHDSLRKLYNVVNDLSQNWCFIGTSVLIAFDDKGTVKIKFIDFSKTRKWTDKNCKLGVSKKEMNQGLLEGITNLKNVFFCLLWLHIIFFARACRLAYAYTPGRRTLDAIYLGFDAPSPSGSRRSTQSNIIKTTDDYVLIEMSNEICIAFRGCNSLDDHKHNISSQGNCYVHKWYYNEFKERLLNSIKQHISKFTNNRNIYICGHSKGGAMAILLANELSKNINIRDKIVVCVFGCPKFGNKEFVQECRKNNYKCLFVMCDKDIVKHRNMFHQFHSFFEQDINKNNWHYINIPSIKDCYVLKEIVNHSISNYVLSCLYYLYMNATRFPIFPHMRIGRLIDGILKLLFSDFCILNAVNKLQQSAVDFNTNDYDNTYCMNMPNLLGKSIRQKLIHTHPRPKK